MDVKSGQFLSSPVSAAETSSSAAVNPQLGGSGPGQPGPPIFFPRSAFESVCRRATFAGRGSSGDGPLCNNSGTLCSQPPHGGVCEGEGGIAGTPVHHLLKANVVKRKPDSEASKKHKM